MFSFLSANSLVGNVELFKGNVKIQSENSIKKNKITEGLEIKMGDLVTTANKSTVRLKLLDGSVVILDESSSLHFTSDQDAEQNSGKILYKITSRDAKNSLKIKTAFAIIGIKRTTFIVNVTDEPSVSLKEGLVGIESLKEEFDLYRQKVQEEFDNYVLKQDADFQSYKNQQDQYLEVEKTMKFDLEERNKVSFDANSVTENKFTKTDDEEFEYFEKLQESIE